MKIATLTLNPAIDLTVRVNHLMVGGVNHAQAMNVKAGGKGVNVAALLADYGLSVSVTGWLGQANAELFEQLCVQKNIADHFVRVPGQTRTNLKIADYTQQQTTDINLPGLMPSPEALRALWQKLECLVETHSAFVLGGTLPPGLSSDFYAELIAFLKARGKTVALDTSNEALGLALKAGPTFAKPNWHELEALEGVPLHEPLAIVAVARRILSYGVKLVAISLGERGAIFVNEATSVLAAPPQVLVNSTVGAGDAMVAGILVALQNGLGLAECAQLSTAFSLAVIAQHPQPFSLTEAIEYYRPQVQVTFLEAQLS